MKAIFLVLVSTLLVHFSAVDAQVMPACPNTTGTAPPPDWPQNCTDAYTAHAENISSFSPEDRSALIRYLNVTCPDCHNSFIDYNIRCGALDQTTGYIWRNTYCLRDDVRDSNEYCRVVIYDFIDNTTMDEEYLTDCANLISGDSTTCSADCRDVLMRTQTYLGCCTSLYGRLSTRRINQAHYATCNVAVPSLCGGPAPQPPACPSTTGMAYPPDWPPNCIEAYTAHARNISSFSPADRNALIQYLNVACPDCHNSFTDYNIRCNAFDQTTGDFWRSTYCLRDDVRDSNRYCRVIIYDFIDTTMMDEEYLTDCADLISGNSTACSADCRDVLMRTQNFLGCCTSLYGRLSTRRINQAHYATCNMTMPRLCGSPTPQPSPQPGYASTVRGSSGFILIALAFFMMTMYI